MARSSAHHATWHPPPVRGLLPRTASGRGAVTLTVLGVASWLVLPAAVRAGTGAPVILPVLGTTLMIAAAVLAGHALRRSRDRSALVVIAAAVSAPMGFLGAVVLVGSALAGV